MTASSRRMQNGNVDYINPVAQNLTGNGTCAARAAGPSADLMMIVNQRTRATCENPVISLSQRGPHHQPSRRFGS